MARMRIGDLLIAAGLIDEMQLSAALSHQRQWGGRLGDALVDKGFLDEMMLWKGLSKQLGLPLVSLPDLEIPASVVAALPAELAQRYDVFPVRVQDRELVLATSDPGNVDMLDEIAFRTGLKVRPALAPPREIEWAIRHYHLGDASPCPPPRTRRVLVTDRFEVVHTDHAYRDDTGDVFASSPAPSPAPASPPASRNLVASVGPASDAEAIQRVEARLRETTHLLRLLVDTCVQRGLFSREEYLERMRRMD